MQLLHMRVALELWRHSTSLEAGGGGGVHTPFCLSFSSALRMIAVCWASPLVSFPWHSVNSWFPVRIHPPTSSASCQTPGIETLHRSSHEVETPPLYSSPWRRYPPVSRRAICSRIFGSIRSSSSCLVTGGSWASCNNQLPDAASSNRTAG